MSRIAAKDDERIHIERIRYNISKRRLIDGPLISEKLIILMY